MNPEMYVYTLVVALIGMTTVFVGLSLLSLMMMLLRRMFQAEARGMGTAPTPIEGSTLRGESDRRWVLAAAAAFLAAEEEESSRTAADWKPRPTQSGDQWSIQPRL